MKELAPSIYIEENVLDNCEEIISLAKSFKNQWSDSAILDSNASLEVNLKIRKNRSFPLFPDFDKPIEWFRISQKFWEYGDWYAKKHEISFSGLETVQLLHYEDKSNFYLSHCDDGVGTSRIFSGIIYLNDVASGGETHFNKFNLTIKPKKGRMVLFPSNFPYRHEARPPTKGEKFVLVCWFTK
jgi:hypothetical protein